MHHTWLPSVAFSQVPLLLGVLALATTSPAAEESAAPAAASERWGIAIDRGVCVVVGLPEPGKATKVIDLARGNQLMIYFQSSRSEEVAQVREAATIAGLLGTQVFVELEKGPQLHLAENLADAVLVAQREASLSDAEILRVLHPDGIAWRGTRRIVKPDPSKNPFLAAIDIASGEDLWREKLAGPVVKAGTAIDSQGRIIVALEDGQVLEYTAP